MLYYLHNFIDVFSPLRVFQYITFRAFAAAATAFIITLVCGPRMIRLLRELKYGQIVRKEEALPLYEFHGKKQGTPTMGGILILVSVTVSTLLWAALSNMYVWAALSTMLFMGMVGMRDDYLKITKKKSRGLGAWSKLTFQVAWAIAIVTFIWSISSMREYAGDLMLPFLKDPVITNMGFFTSLLFLGIVLVGSTNAVNLTDGLDGLAIGCSNSAVIAYLIMAYVSGHAIFADYLQIPHITGGGELAVFCGALLGAGLGFLWYNCHPAKVFMGDTGSLALGGAIAMVAILIKQELLLIIVGGVFVMEAVSVLLQVSFFKFTRAKYGEGRRLLRCAPLHHHFELKEKDAATREGREVGVVETMITIRFWILSILFALIGVATLKLR